MADSRSGRKKVALLLVGMVLGAALITPAGAHVTSVAHSWKKHFLPLAKKAFYTKKQTFSKSQSDARFDAQRAALGKTQTGVYSFVGTDGSGYVGTTIDFDQMLPGPIAAGNAHYVTAPTAQCPGAGQAAAGHLCIYQEFLNGATFFDVFSPTDDSTLTEDASRQGAMLVFAISATTPNGRGTWAVRPAAATTSSLDADGSSEAPPGFGG